MTTSNSNTALATEIDVYPKVIFLDIEGVIVTHRSIIVNHDLKSNSTYRGGRPGWDKFIDKLALGLVVTLAKEYGAKIVVTSTLRGMPGTLPGLRLAAPHWCTPTDLEDFLCEEHIEFLDTKEEGIAAFVAKHDVLSYVVFDDCIVKCSNFIRVNGHDGLTWEDYQVAKEYLTSKGDSPEIEQIFL